MNDMSKQQLVLLVLLVSFVTALVTGIVAVTLLNQAPQPITQTVQRVIEKTIGSLPEPLKKDEKKELEANAMARDVLIEDIVQRVSPSVVSIVAAKDIPVIEQYFINPFPNDDFFGDIRIPQYRQRGTERRQVSSGSGFFVSSDGYILTNRHVVEDAEAEYSVIMNDGRKLKAKVLARDVLNDAAVLKVDGTYVPIDLGDSESLRIGQTAIAIGNALGEFQNTVSIGVISGLRRTIIASGALSGPEELSQLIQTDAAINLGNSGGPLLNLRGGAIGLNTAKAQNAENVGFAIPINQIKRALRDVQTKGRIVNPYVGVRYVLVTPQLKEKNKLSVDYGALITQGAGGEDAVLLNSPASKAGIKESDIILEFGGIKVNIDNPLNKLIQLHSVGDKVTIKILRDGREIKLELTLEERKNF
ncbi:MAG: trypsin-like peptidase domain-containing protein [Candidatus Giovannonibacteria bacterium]|nr:MAG: trypsin-like peptidase domain-containing protein [Candidatus Giovannonibacteria bacterium]